MLIPYVRLIFAYTRFDSMDIVHTKSHEGVSGRTLIINSLIPIHSVE